MITQKEISDILRPLLASGAYKDENRALRDIVADYVQRKVESYNAVILRMEKTHGKSFAAFSRGLKQRASAAKEDEWMEWKAAIEMREAWQRAFKKLLRNAS